MSKTKEACKIAYEVFEKAYKVAKGIKNED